MATKTIKVDAEAYDRLKKAQRPNESLSQTIKRVVPLTPDLDLIMRETSRRPVGEDFVRVVDDIVSSRRSRSRRKLSPRLRRSSS